MTITRQARVLLAVIAVVLIAGGIFLVQALRYGFSAHDEPTALEAMMATMMRHYSTPADLRDAKNPLPATAEILAEGRAHFADHCATCHGNDGKGKTEMGPRFYPKVPDMSLQPTQSQTDGELFSTIENGVRMTGMPGWGDGSAASARGSWALVAFIRHLPNITPEELAEMEKLNPKSPDERQEARNEENFLEGGDGSSPAATQTQQQLQHRH